MRYQLPRTLLAHLDTLPHGSTIKERQWITTNDLLYIQRAHLSHIPLSTILEGLTPYSPKPVTRTYTPAFQKQLDALRSKVQEQEYQQIVHRGKTQVDDDFVSPSQVWKEVNSYITNIINVMVTVLAVVWAVWTWTSYNTEVFKLHYRVLLCLFFGLLALVADVVVLNAFMRKMDEAKTKELRKKEFKKVIETVVIKKAMD